MASKSTHPSRLFLFALLPSLLWISPLRAQDIPASGTAAKGPDTQQVNELFGIPLWPSDDLWSVKASELAAALSWPLESRTSTTSSYRLYPPNAYQLLGTHPYSVALFADDDKVSRLSIVFANKGDEKGNYYAAIARDKQTLITKFTLLFGPPVGSRFGDDREQVKRWDWNGHVFLLSAPSGEYVLLRIVPKDTADSKGVADKIKPKDFFNKLAAHVLKRDNGDIIVDDIPMVDQGPKGYCVPATWERYLRYLGFEADMYVLAMQGGTVSGGGTSMESMVTSVNSTIQDRGYHIQQASFPLTALGVSKSIDAGVPLMWGIFTCKDVEVEISIRSRARKLVTDWDDWTRQIKADRYPFHAADMSDKKGHLCMIIGYNLKTKELAVSDSWGPGFAERWISEAEAAVINKDGLFSITK